MKEEYYLNPKSELRKSSIQGIGLFASQKISRGELIHIATGKIVDVFNNELTESEEEFCYQINETQMLCPLDPQNPSADWYINHSCDPNSGYPEDGDYRKLVALRDINEGEEITYDYAKDPGELQMNCRCGSPNCRRIITGEKR